MDLWYSLGTASLQQFEQVEFGYRSGSQSVNQRDVASLKFNDLTRRLTKNYRSLMLTYRQIWQTGAIQTLAQTRPLMQEVIILYSMV